MRWLQVQPGKINDCTTASNICLQISNKEYCSKRLRKRINSLGPRNPRCKFKSSAAPVTIKSDNYATSQESASLLSGIIKLITREY